MRTSLRLAGGTALAALLVPLLLAAQPSSSAATPADSLPFRPGQWGAEFNARDGAAASVLRFHAADRAFIGTITGELSRNDSDRNEFRRYAAGVQLGHRWYRPAATSAIAPYWGLGLVASILSDRREVVIAGNPTSTAVADDRSVSVGAFGELGAQWLVTPRLGLGAAWQLSVLRRRTDAERVSASPPSEPPSTTLSAFAAPLALRATLYF